MQSYAEKTIKALKASKQYQRIKLAPREWHRFPSYNSEVLYSLAYFGIIDLNPVRLGVIEAKLALEMQTQ